MLSNWPAMVGALAAILTSAANVPQVLKVVRGGPTKDLSQRMLIALSTGLTLWVVYGFAISDPALILGNLFGSGLATTLLIYKFKER